MRMMMDADYPGFKVIDDATGAEIKDVLWVDYWALEYATGTGGMKVVLLNPTTGIFTCEVDETVTQITRFSVNWAAREIHVNEPPAQIVVTGNRVLRACGECCQPGTCSRINYCAAGRCNFGEFARP